MSIYELENFRISNLKKIKILKFSLPLFLAPAFIVRHEIGFLNLFYFGILLSVFVSEIKRYKYHILAFCVILYVALFRLNSPNEITITIALCVGMFWFYFACFQTSAYKIQERYKDYFLGEFLPEFAEKFGYEFERYGKIKYGLIRDSKIFKPDYKLYADNKIFGKFNGLDFEFARLFLYDKDKKNDPICGAFFHATLDKSINSKFFIISNDAEFNATKNLKKFTAQDSKFNEIFSIYSSDTQTASYILTPIFMKRIVNLKKRLNFPIYISFIDEKICIFVASGRENFEPDIYKSVLYKNPAKTIKRELLYFLGLVKTLNLNAKI